MYHNLYLFDGFDNLKLRRGVEFVSLFTQQQLEVACDVTASDVHPNDAVWHGEPLVDRHSMRHTVTRVQNHTCCATCGIPMGKTMEYLGQ